jgi:hypothetical protein
MREQKKEQLLKAFIREKEIEENFSSADEEIREKVFNKYRIHKDERGICKNYILQKLKEQERERQKQERERQKSAELDLFFKEKSQEPRGKIPEIFNPGPPR